MTDFPSSLEEQSFDLFYKKIQFLSEAERLFLCFINSQGDEEIENREAMFLFLDENLNQFDKDTLHDFLKMIYKVFVSRIYRDVLIDHVFEIIEYFLSHQDPNGDFLLNVFSKLELFHIFSNNKHIISRFYNTNFISPDDLLNFLFHFNDNSIINRDFVQFILEHHSESLKAHNPVVFNHIIKKLDPLRFLNHSFSLAPRNKKNNKNIALDIILEDDIDNFINFTSQTNFGYKNSSPFSSNIFCDITIFESVMLFGAINIFKYIISQRDLLKQMKLSSLKYAIMGGNLDIIHIIENSTEHKFDKECYMSSITFHHEDIQTYIADNYENDIPEEEELTQTLKSYNFVHFASFLSNKKSFFDRICQNGTIFDSIMDLGCILLFKYLLDKPDFDINKKDRVLF